MLSEQEYRTLHTALSQTIAWARQLQLSPISSLSEALRGINIELDRLRGVAAMLEKILADAPETQGEKPQTEPAGGDESGQPIAANTRQSIGKYSKCR